MSVTDEQETETNGLPSKSQALPDLGTKDRYLYERMSRLSVIHSAQAAGVARATVYRWREADPAFADAEKEAAELAIGVLESNLYQRALAGSDTASIFLLKSHKPDIYNRPTEVRHGGAENAPPIELAHRADRIIEKFRQAREDSRALPPAEETVSDSVLPAEME